MYTKQLKDAFNLGKPLPLPDKTFSPYFDSQSTERLNQSFRNLLALHDLSFNTLLPYGTIPQSYVESSSGRLYGQGLNLQNTVREVRKVALKELPYCEYDFSNCHFNILYQVAKSEQIRCSDIEYYLNYKHRIRKDLAKRIEVPVQEIKQCLLALIYGARTVLWKGNAVPDIIGLEKAKKLFNEPFYKSLRDDIQRAMNVLLKQADKRGKYLINQMRKAIKNDSKKSEIIAHLLQGYEAKMLNIAMTICPEKMIVLQHDGWICKPNINSSAIEEAIKKKLNIKIHIEQKINYSGI